MVNTTGFLGRIFGFGRKEEKAINREVKKKNKKDKSLILIESLLKKHEKAKDPKKKDELAKKAEIILSKNEEELLAEFNNDEKILEGLVILGRHSKQIEEEINHWVKTKKMHTTSPFFGQPKYGESNNEALDNDHRQTKHYVNSINNLRAKLREVTNKRKILWEQLGEDLTFELSKIHMFNKISKEG
ncbi:hypothetical protein HN385_05965 [archaeon]|jgi:hypothetical protein|nr:hypothetical protein [archaeon]MBT3451096.1 hypothetical protein [archaeon]MBT6868660.1 hypothetical protein [archaeon]MBT7193373.1 hypothetical protein [archaeon]MBT7381457.1 hypothetical protein [archaeon]